METLNIFVVTLLCFLKNSLTSVIKFTYLKISKLFALANISYSAFYTAVTV